MPDDRSHPRVFISFAHESDEHDALIQSFADRLRGHGIDAVTYLKELFPEEGWTLWMERRIREADFVLMVCTETYRRRVEGEEVEGKGGGAKYEGALIRNLFHRAGAVNRKFIPVVLRHGDSGSIPLRFYDFTSFTIREFDFSDGGYEKLYRVLTRQQPEQAPVGKLVVLAPVPSLASVPDPRARPWSVPPRNRYFTGRDGLLDRLRDELEREGRAALSGLGGMGKTQTAVQYAYRYRGEYSAVFWVRADTQAALVSDLGEIARLLDLPEKDAQQHTLTNAVARWLAKHPGWLLVLDNADTPQLVAPFLPPEGTGHLLLTSRAQVFDVLGIAKPLEISELAPAEAYRFLLERTGREEDGEPESGAARGLAAELGFLPLALEQAGAFIKENGSRFQDYLLSFRKQRMRLLEEQGPVVGGYPESVRTTWTINFREVEQRSAATAELLRLSAFLSPDDIPLELLEHGAPYFSPVLFGALQNAAGDPLVLDRTLRPLTQYSLVRRNVPARAYSIHRLVQEALREEMSPEAQREWAERAVSGVSHAFPSTSFGNWPQCDRLLPHARACVSLIDLFGIVSEEATQLLYRAGAYVRERGYVEEARRLSVRATTMGERIDHPHVAISLTSAAATFRDRGDYAEAERMLLRALAIAQAAPVADQDVLATCWNNLGDIYRLQGRFAEAEPLVRKGLATRSQLHGEGHPLTARSRHDLGVLHLDQGLYAEAEEHLERARQIREEVLAPNDPDLARSLDGLARLYTRQGRYAEAEPLFERALAIAVPSLGEHHFRVGYILQNYAELLRATGREAKAGELAERAEQIRAASQGHRGPGEDAWPPPPSHTPSPNP